MAFPVFTSIKPPVGDDELSYLRRCIGSWRAAGFDPVAINGPSEIKMLRGLDLPVEFAPLPIDGKPRIGAILSVIRDSGLRFAGIINSDCKVVAYPDVAGKLRAGLAGTVRVAWRMDVGEGKPTACLGFDAYFFDTAILPDDDAGYSIGGPWWDYWFPLACEVAGAKIETIPVPLLTHRVHPLNYSQQDEIAGCGRFWTALEKWYADGRDIPGWPFAELYRRDRTRSALSVEQLAELGNLVRPWIRRNGSPAIAFMPSEMDEIESMLRAGGEALIANAEAHPLQSELNLLRSEANRLRSETQFQHSELAAMRNSISWRITTPLRCAAIAVREISAKYRHGVARSRRRLRLRTRAKAIMQACRLGAFSAGNP